MLVTEETFKESVDFLRDKDELVIDTETTGLEIYKDDRMVGISIYSEGKSFYFAFRHKTREPDVWIGENPADTYYPSNLPEDYIPTILDILNGTEKHVYFNATFDLHVLFREGMKRPKIIEDVMIAAHLMNENEPTFQLKVLADKYIDPLSSNSDLQLKSLLKSKGLGKGNISELDPSEVAQYAEDDVILTYKLREFYKPYLVKYGLDKLWVRDNEFQQTLNRMEHRGIKLDKHLCLEYLKECGLRASEYKFALQEIVGSHLLNPNSSKQIQGLLKVPKANRKMLQRLIEDDDIHPVYRYIAKNVLMYRIWTKADTTYYLPYLKHVDSRSILHPHFNVIGTVSARLSSNNPNMTAVPRESTEYKVKDVFVARPGYTLLEFDLSQAEMRIACYYSREEKMIALLNNNEDIHQATADSMGVSRYIGKTLNFAVIYSVGVNGLIQLLGIEEDESRQYLKDYHSTYPGFKRAAQYYSNVAKEQGYVKLYTGRMRRFYTIENGTIVRDPKGPHKAFNSVIQGTVAEIMRTVMLRVDKELREKMDMHMLLQVHDSLLVEVPENNWKECAKALQHIMEDFPFNPRVTVEGVDKDGRIHIGKVGTRWGRMSKIYKDEIYGSVAA